MYSRITHKNFSSSSTQSKWINLRCEARGKAESEWSQQIRLGRKKKNVTVTRDWIWMFTSFAECRDDYVIQRREKGNQVSGDERSWKFPTDESANNICGPNLHSRLLFIWIQVKIHLSLIKFNFIVVRRFDCCFNKCFHFLLLLLFFSDRSQRQILYHPTLSSVSMSVALNDWFIVLRWGDLDA